MSSITVFIAVKLPVSADLYDHMGGEGIDHGRTNAVETTGYLIYRAVKLAAGMKNGIDNANGRDLLGWMDVYRDASSVILNADATVPLQGNMYLAAKACKLLINGIV